MFACLLALIMTIPPAPVELDAYLRSAPGPTTLHRTGGDDVGGARETRYRFTSQTWQGVRWEHDLAIYLPGNAAATETAIFLITGDGPFERDRRMIDAVLTVAKLPVVVLYDVPNQPIFDMREDDLIAHTFERYLETGDPAWPLLMPMTAAATRAMDAVKRETKGGPNPIRRFVVTGASKRGWTTWLTAAAGRDDIAGIAPMVFDNLDFAAQMRHQMRSWGRYSPMIEDYTRRGLQQRLDTPEGRKLEALVDPHAYRARFKAPTLIVNGANDPFWAVDALSLYWDRLRQPRWAIVVPNVAHGLGDGPWALASVSAFARVAAGLGEMPKAGFRVTDGWAAVAAEPGLRSLALWIAEGPDLDFRQTAWKQVGATSVVTDGLMKVSAPPQPRDRRRAVLAIAEYDIAGVRCHLSAPVRVVH